MHSCIHENRKNYTLARQIQIGPTSSLLPLMLQVHIVWHKVSKIQKFGPIIQLLTLYKIVMHYVDALMVKLKNVTHQYRNENPFEGL